MKLWAMLRIVVDGFGEVDIFLTQWTSTGAENKYLFSNTCKVLTYFWLLLHCFYPKTVFKLYLHYLVLL